jgi:hypothetical protein
MKKLFSATILVVIIWMTILEVSNSLGNLQMRASSLAFSSAASSQVWNVSDIITPTLDSVKWIEEGNYSTPPSWISDGRWYEAHRRQSLIKSDNHIFVSLNEIFNWTAVNVKNWTTVEPSLPTHFSSFYVFKDAVSEDPSWWLKYSWGVDVNRHGVPLDKISVSMESDDSTSRAEVDILCRITNIPEYIIGEKRLENWLTGFDLTSISIGDLEAFEWSEDITASGRYYYIYFKAPANLLSQYKDMYSLVLDVSPSYQGLRYNIEQKIQISMPPNTEVQSASPSNMSTPSGNTATFIIHHSDRYPMSFSVTSGSPIKDVIQSFAEGAGRWIVEPSTWVAFASLIVLLYTAFRGKRIWSRRRTYYRLYRSMVSLYDHHALNCVQFYQELDNLSKSITKYFIEDKITDDQFDKLLTRRDDLIERAKKLQPPAPPKL